jgi:hypothetical protein
MQSDLKDGSPAYRTARACVGYQGNLGRCNEAIENGYLGYKWAYSDELPSTPLGVLTLHSLSANAAALTFLDAGSR